MTRAKHFPRRRPSADATTQSADPPAPSPGAAVLAPPAQPERKDAAALLREHLNASLVQASSVPASNDGARTQDASGPHPSWRARLSDLGRAVGLEEEQEAELERLARTQQQSIREEIPRLLAELKPHFGTPGEAEAKQRHEAGLRALKAALDAQTDALLERLGLVPPAD